MALSVVQTGPKIAVGSIVTTDLTFSSPPTVGNGIIIPVLGFTSIGLAGGSFADNHGNTYALAVSNFTSSISVAIFYCRQIEATGSPFTMTFTIPGGAWVVSAPLEIGGVGEGLLIDRTTSATGSSTTPATGNLAALTKDSVMLVGCCAAGGNLTSVTVESLSPAWVQAFEHLSFAQQPGEADTRILSSGALGTTPAGNWTIDPTRIWSAAIAAFAAEGVDPVRVTQTGLEVIEVQSPTPARITQTGLEILGSLLPSATRITQIGLEIIKPAGCDVFVPPAPPPEVIVLTDTPPWSIHTITLRSRAEATG